MVGRKGRERRRRKGRRGRHDLNALSLPQCNVMSDLPAATFVITLSLLPSSPLTSGASSGEVGNRVCLCVLVTCLSVCVQGGRGITEAPSNISNKCNLVICPRPRIDSQPGSQPTQAADDRRRQRQRRVWHPFYQYQEGRGGLVFSV